MNDPPVRDIKVRMAVVYINILIASTTFARHTPEVKDSVTQSKRTPSELLKHQHSPDVAKNCGAWTTGYELLREFSSSCEPENEVDLATSPKYASDTSLNTSPKKRNESSSKYKTFKQCQRSSFVSYVNLDSAEFGVTSTPNPSSVSSRRRVKSDGHDPEDESELSDEVADQLPPMNKALPGRMRSVRPESYMLAVGSQNAIDTSHFKDLPQAGIDTNRGEEEFV